MTLGSAGLSCCESGRVEMSAEHRTLVAQYVTVRSQPHILILLPQADVH